MLLVNVKVGIKVVVPVYTVRKRSDKGDKSRCSQCPLSENAVTRGIKVVVPSVPLPLSENAGGN